MTQDNDRRDSLRVDLNQDVVVYAQGRALTCRLANLSENGLCLEPPASARAGLHLIVDMDLDRGQTVAIEGYVVREDAQGQSYRWGVRFHQVPPRIRQMLIDYIRGQRSSALNDLATSDQVPLKPRAVQTAELPVRPDIVDVLAPEERIAARETAESASLEQELQEMMGELYQEALETLDAKDRSKKR